MAETADTLHGDQVAGNGFTVAQGVVSGDSGAKQRSGFGWIETIGNAGYRFDGRDHELFKAAVVGETSDVAAFAIGEISGAAGGASVVLSAMPAYADAIAFRPGGDTGADLVDDAGDFVAGNARISGRPETLFHVVVL
jgi:hypothetical protein